MSPIRSQNGTCLAIGERHLPIESTIASRSTDVMVDSMTVIISFMAATQITNNNSIRNEQKLRHLEEALPEAPPATATAVVRNAYTRRELKTMFQQQAEQELFETIKAFHACKLEEGQLI
ncbi:hypothetical protein Tco_1418339 [Tanacetum coccineum]